MRWWIYLVVALVIVAVDRRMHAQEVKVSGASGKIAVKVEEPRKGFLQQWREARLERRQPKVVVVNGQPAATVQIPATLPEPMPPRKPARVVVE